ncbi:MAG: pitrilysin family protein [Bryobacteraceae bacterium]
MTRALLALSLTFGLAAQEIDRTKPPQTPPLANFKLPPTVERTLPNGLRVVMVNDARYPMLELRMGFPAGSKFDPADRDGLAETVAALLDEGAGSRNAKQIAEELTAIGGSLSASVSPDSLTLSGYALSEYTNRLLDLLADMTRRATFAEDELRLHKQNRVQELAAERAQSSTLADEQFYDMVFHGHPYARTLPPAAAIEKISRADLVTFRDKFLTPAGAVLVLVGPVGNGAATLKQIEARFADWAKKPVPEPPAPKFPEPARSIALVDRPGSVQADVRIGRRGITRTDPDYFPLIVGNSILGGGTASRLFNNIREKQGFAYSVGSAVIPRKDAGLVEAQMEVRNEVLGKAVEAMLGELNRIASERVSADELSNVKNYLNGNFVMGVAGPTGVANQLLSVRLNGVDPKWLEKYVERIRQVEPDQIQSAAAKYLKPADHTIVVVGDAAQIEGALGQFGTVKKEKAKQ